MNHDFDSISPSAYALLTMKSQTSIPYMREAAEMLNAKAQYQPDFGGDKKEFWISLLHFESRYWSIDQLLADLLPTNILELSSGFSFRGLALTKERPVHYIDTDLPALISVKQRFVDALKPEKTPGHYELQPLNVLDEKAFEETVQKFPPGPLTIVNEGLLVYLDQKEKEQLCKNIRKTLEKRGGCWITADIYIKRKDGDPLLTKNESYRKWSEKHNLEEKKFASFDDAKSFFEQVGFKIDKEAKPDYSRLTSLSNLRRIAGTTAGSSSQPDRTRLHATWQLSLRPKY